MPHLAGNFDLTNNPDFDLRMAQQAQAQRINPWVSGW